MNEMPGMPTQESGSSVPSNESVISEGLDVPTIEKVEVIDAAESESEIKLPKVPVGGIEVVATRKGFFGQQRYKKDDKFFVKSFEELGEWMKCSDSNFEKQRVAFFKEKKAKQIKLKELKEKAKK